MVIHSNERRPWNCYYLLWLVLLLNWRRLNAQHNLNVDDRHTIPVHDPMSISGLDILLKTGTLERVLQKPQPPPPLLYMPLYCSYYINCKPHPHITISNIILPFCFNDNKTRSGPRSKLNLPPPHLHWTRNHHHNVPFLPFECGSIGLSMYGDAFD